MGPRATRIGPRRSVREAHPTMKPVELVARRLGNSTKKNDVVYELLALLPPDPRYAAEHRGSPRRLILLCYALAMTVVSKFGLRVRAAKSIAGRCFHDRKRPFTSVNSGA